MTVGTNSQAVTLSMKGSQYMYFATGTAYCKSYIQKYAGLDAYNYWLMGLPFYRAFEINHNMMPTESPTMGFKSITTATVVDASAEGATYY